MEKTIALIPGDGIGPDVVAEAVNVLDAVAAKYGHKWNYTNVIAGGCAIDKFGNLFRRSSLTFVLNQTRHCLALLAVRNGIIFLQKSVQKRLCLVFAAE